MKFLNKRSLMTAIFLSVIIFSACEKPETELGLNLQDNTLNTQSSILVDIQAEMIRIDSVKTDSLSSNLCGNYIDPKFGATSTAMGFNLELSNSTVDFGNVDEIEIDSIVLALTFTGYTYGKSVDQSFSVKRITSEFSIDSSYYSDFEPDLSMEEYILDENETYSFDFDTPVELGDNIFDPQIRLNIDPSLGTVLLGDGVWATNADFLEVFEGLYVQSTTEDGGVIGYDLKYFGSRLTMYYHNTVDNTPTEFVFNIDETTATVSTFSHDYTGSLSLLNIVDSKPANDLLYIQSAASIEGKIKLPELKDMFTENESINKAEIVVPVNNTDFSRFTLPPSLLIVLKDENGNLEFLPDNAFSGYISSSNEYRFNISKYVQSLVRNNLPMEDLYIIPLSSGITVNRVVLNGPLYNSGNTNQNMRLELAFTK